MNNTFRDCQFAANIIIIYNIIIICNFHSPVIF